MKSLGYYAKDKNGNLFQFEWTKDDVLLIDGISVSAEDYEILELFHSTADTIESPKTVDDLNELALPMIAELVEEGIISVNKICEERATLIIVGPVPVMADRHGSS